MVSKIAKGKMHEQPRWIAREVLMEGDEWRRFHDAGGSGAGIEAIKLLRIFRFLPCMHPWQKLSKDHHRTNKIVIAS